MSEKRNMYANSKIYKIINNLNDDIYIGSTVKQLSNRMAGHRTFAKNLINKSRIYTTMRNNGISNYSIILVESFNCNNKEQLRQREDYYIQLLKPKLNMNNAVFNKEREKATQKVYQKTEKFKAGHKAFQLSDKGKAYNKAYKKTEKCIATNKAYRKTEKCKVYDKGYKKTEKYIATDKAYRKSENYKIGRKNYFQFVEKPKRQNKRINDRWAKDKAIFYDLCSKIDQMILQQ